MYHIYNNNTVLLVISHGCLTEFVSVSPPILMSIKITSDLAAA